MSPVILVVIVGVFFVAIAFHALRKGWVFKGSSFQKRETFLPTPTPPASRAARCVETLMMGIGGFTVLAANIAQLCLCGDTRWDRPWSMYITLYVLISLGAAVGIGIASLIAFWGKTRLGVVVMVLVGIAYVVGSNSNLAANHIRPWELNTSDIDPSSITWTIDLNNTNIKGADLWVNDVYLGKTPYVTTLSEFEAKVPYWPDPPADFKTANWNQLPRTACISGGCVKPNKKEDVHQESQPTSSSLPHVHPKCDQPVLYYAKIRYAGEWGIPLGYCSGGGIKQLQAGLISEFSMQQKRMKSLLNQARLADYHVGPDWFKAAETYQGDVWVAVQKAAGAEPRMVEVLNAWAAWRYGLDQVTDEESAWRAFQKICEEADAEKIYLTTSVAGWAVEMLVPRLPQERLVNRAVELISRMGAVDYTSYQFNGRLQFGCIRQNGYFLFGDTCCTSSLSSWDGTKSQSPPVSGFPIAHAVWRLYEQLRAEDPSKQNIVQQRIVPVVLRSQYEKYNDHIMLVAASLGGDVVDKFLLRQNSLDQPTPFDGRRMFISGREVNPWFYTLLYLDDEAGDRWRHQNVEKIMEFADTSYLKYNFSWFEDNKFIFQSPWLAKEYWPRFAALVRSNPRGSIQHLLTEQWRYLERMGDAATVEMYLDAWDKTNILYADFAFADSPKRLKAEVRRPLLEALIQRVQEHRENLQDVLKTSNANEVIRLLKLQDDANSSESLAEKLSKATRPEDRIAVVNALLTCATPENRALLEKLQSDSDSGVREAAQVGLEQLKTLAAQKTSEFVADPTGGKDSPGVSPDKPNQ
jgi:hypothetical protein